MSKTLSKFKHVFLQNQGHDIHFTNGSVDYSAGGSFEILKGFSVSYGDNYVDWRQRLANNQQCTTSLTATEYTLESSRWAVHHEFFPKPSTQVFVPTYKSYAMFGDFIPDPVSGFNSPLDKVSLTLADNIAKAKYLSNIQSNRTAFQGGVFFGEIAETLHLIKSPLSALQHGLGSYLNTLKKRRSGFQRLPMNNRLSRASKMIADTWLEYSFGWRPLLMDIDGAMQALARISTNERFAGAPCIGHGSDKFVKSHQISVASAGSHKHTALQTDTFEVFVKYYGWLGHDFASTSSWNTQLGFTFEQFVPTVWELIPYSFLVDYFTNIGDIIYGITTNTTGLNWTGRTQVEKCTTVVYPLVAGLLSPPSDLICVVNVVGDAKLTYAYKKVSRAAYNSSLVPTLDFHVPGRWNRYVNIAALLLGGRALQPFVR